MKATAGKSGLLSSQGISVSITIEAANSGSLTHTFAEGSLLLRCFLKVGIRFQSKPGNKLSSRDDIGCMVLPRVAVLKLVFL